MNSDHTLRFEPVEELQLLREHESVQENITVSENTEGLQLQDGYSCEIKLSVDLKEQCMYFDRDRSDGWSRGVSRSPLRMKDKETLDVHVFMDKSSIEVFAENYSTNHSCNVFADEQQNQNFLTVSGGVLKIKSLKMWDLIKVMDC